MRIAGSEGWVLVCEVERHGLRTPKGNRMDKKYLYRMLNNRTYIGEAVHKGQSYPGEHEAIVSQELWDKVHAILKESPRKRAANIRAQTPALLKGLLYGPDGTAFSPTHTRKDGRLYRYYVSQTVLKHGAGSCLIGRVPAGEIETAVIDKLYQNAQRTTHRPAPPFFPSPRRKPDSRATNSCVYGLRCRLSPIGVQGNSENNLSAQIDWLSF